MVVLGDHHRERLTPPRQGVEEVVEHHYTRGLGARLHDVVQKLTPRETPPIPTREGGVNLGVGVSRPQVHVEHGGAVLNLSGLSGHKHVRRLPGTPQAQHEDGLGELREHVERQHLDELLRLLPEEDTLRPRLEVENREILDVTDYTPTIRKPLLKEGERVTHGETNRWESIRTNA